MGGGANVPMIQCKTSSSIFPSLSPPPPSPSPSPSPSPFSSLNFPISLNNTSSLRHYSTSDSCCYCPAENKNELYKDIFGPVPSQFEVETAISALQNFLQGICSSESEVKQTFGGYGRFEEACYFLLREPSIKRLVISLSSDRAVWDALMNNQMVRQLMESYAIPTSAAHNHRIKSCKEEPDAIDCILSWLMDVTKAKLTELIQKFELLMNQIFRQPERNKQTEESKEEMDDRVASSFVLSLVILLIVVVARFQMA